MTTAFSIWLALVQLLGPWLCCCPAAPVPASAASPSAPADACPLCRKAPVAPAKPTPAPPAKPCPCVGLQAVTEAGALRTPSATEELGAVHFDADWPNAVAFDPSAGRADATPPAEPRPLNAASLPPGTRLRVHHALRL